MAEPLRLPPPGFDDLPMDEKIEYVQTLWDRIAADSEQIPVPEWQRAVLDERLAAHRRDPSGGTPWEESLERVRKELKQRR